MNVSLRNFQKQLMILHKETQTQPILKGVEVKIPNLEKPMEIEVQIQPAKGLWKKCILAFAIKCTEAWPQEAPVVSAITRILHPNVQPDTGKVCMNVISKNYGIHVTLKGVVTALKQLIEEPPQFDDAINSSSIQSFNSGRFEKDVESSTIFGGNFGGFRFTKCRKPSTYVSKLLKSCIDVMKNVNSPSPDKKQMERGLNILGCFKRISQYIDLGIFRQVSKDCKTMVDLIEPNQSKRVLSKVSSIFFCKDSIDLYLHALKQYQQNTDKLPKIIRLIKSYLDNYQQLVEYNEPPIISKLVKEFEQYVSTPHSDQSMVVYHTEKIPKRLDMSIHLMCFQDPNQTFNHPAPPHYSGQSLLWRKLYDATVSTNVDNIKMLNSELQRYHLSIPHIQLGVYKNHKNDSSFSWSRWVKHQGTSSSSTKYHHVTIIAIGNDNSHCYNLNIPCSRYQKSRFHTINSSGSIGDGDNMTSLPSNMRLPSTREYIAYRASKFRADMRLSLASPSS